MPIWSQIQLENVLTIYLKREKENGIPFPPLFSSRPFGPIHPSSLSPDSAQPQAEPPPPPTFPTLLSLTPRLLSRVRARAPFLFLICSIPVSAFVPELAASLSKPPRAVPPNWAAIASVFAVVSIAFSPSFSAYLSCAVSWSLGPFSASSGELHGRRPWNGPRGLSPATPWLGTSLPRPSLSPCAVGVVNHAS